MVFVVFYNVDRFMGNFGGNNDDNMVGILFCVLILEWYWYSLIVVIYFVCSRCMIKYWFIVMVLKVILLV